MTQFQGLVALALASVVSTTAACTKSPSFFSMLQASVTMTIEDGAVATRKRVLSVKFSNSALAFQEMRVAEVSQFAGDVPWVPYAPSTTVDLGSAFAEDGSLDAPKTIRAEFRLKAGVSGSEKAFAQSSILLDTLPPRASAQGLLKDGLPKGEKYPSVGQAVAIAWSAEDVASSVTGSASGFDSKAVRIGWSRKESCDPSSLTLVGADWGPNTGASSLPWPGTGPIDTFYVCVIVQDAARNQFTLLSQPMTSLWEVVAGDNNQGNGGSVTAHNVRFNAPRKMVVDSQKSLYVYDNYFNVLRRITANGDISLVAGNGQPTTPKAGPALQSPMDVQSLAIDAKDRIYLVSHGTYWRLTPAGSGEFTLEALSAKLNGLLSLGIEKKSGVAYLARVKQTNGAVEEAESYIYRVTIEELDRRVKSGSLIDLAALNAGFVFAGNGKGRPTNKSVPNDFMTDVPATESLSYPRTVYPVENGDVYYASNADGSGFPYGHHQIRVLTKVGGTLMNRFIANLPWVTQMELVTVKDPADGQMKKLLLAGAVTQGLRSYDLTSGTLPASGYKTIDPHPSAEPLHPFYVGGIAVIPSASDPVDTIVYTESDNSRIVRMNSAFARKAIYGRPVYDAADTNATEAMVNTPSGIAESSTGDIYLFEAMSHILRKVDKQGKISLVAGSPGVRSRDADTSTPTLSEAKFDAMSYSHGYQWGIAYDEAKNILYVQEGGQRRIRRLDLTASKATYLQPYPGTTPTSQDPATSGTWSPNSIAFAPSAPGVDSSELWVYRYLASNPRGAAATRQSHSSGANPTVIAGSGPVTDTNNPLVPGNALSSPIPADVRASAVDTKLNYYFSSAPGTYQVTPSKQLSRVGVDGGFDSMVLFEDATGSFLVGTRGTKLAKLELGKPGARVEELCLPGTFLNVARQVAKARDGNLLIADTHSSRVLRYYVRDDQGRLKFTTAAECSQ